MLKLKYLFQFGINLLTFIDIKQTDSLNSIVKRLMNNHFLVV